MRNQPFNDPREPWITRGILISLASLFDLCKGLGVKFEGNGDYRAPHFSIPGRKAVAAPCDSGDIQYVADEEFFASCVVEVRDINVELAKAINLLRDFNNKLSVQNLVHQLVFPSGRPDVLGAISNARIGDTISDFTFDFQELVELSELLQVSFRNRKSHRKLHDGSDKAFLMYHHALMSRFLQLVTKCSEYTQSRGWCTKGPSESEQEESLPMIQNHIVEFKALTRVIFDEIGPPLHDVPDALEGEGFAGRSTDAHESDSSSENNANVSISKNDLYDIADAIREAHDESGSYVAWLEERLSSLVTSTAEDLKNSLLEPWKNKSIEALLDLIARQEQARIDAERLGDSPLSVAVASGTVKIAQIQDSISPKPRVTPVSRASQAEIDSEKIRVKLRELCKEMRNRLNQINPRFEFYHCVLQSPIVVPAIQQGVCSYGQLKQTDEFQSRIVVGNRSFMLDEQERLYRERIDKVLSENRINR